MGSYWICWVYELDIYKLQLCKIYRKVPEQLKEICFDFSHCFLSACYIVISDGFLLNNLICCLKVFNFTI